MKRLTAALLALLSLGAAAAPALAAGPPSWAARFDPGEGWTYLEGYYHDRTVEGAVWRDEAGQPDYGLLTVQLYGELRDKPLMGFLSFLEKREFDCAKRQWRIGRREEHAERRLVGHGRDQWGGGWNIGGYYGFDADLLRAVCDAEPPVPAGDSPKWEHVGLEDRDKYIHVLPERRADGAHIWVRTGFKTPRQVRSGRTADERAEDYAADCVSGRLRRVSVTDFESHPLQRPQYRVAPARPPEIFPAPDSFEAYLLERACPGPEIAWAPWRRVGANKDGPVFAQLTTDGTPRVRVRFDTPSGLTLGGQVSRAVVFEHKIDCATRRSRALSSTPYTATDLKTPLHRLDWPDRPWEDVSPRSGVAIALAVACRPPGEPVAAARPAAKPAKARPAPARSGAKPPVKPATRRAKP